MHLVQAKTTTWIDTNIQIVRGQVWDAEHPVVKTHPDYFTDDDPTLLDHPTPIVERAVEELTAVPGRARPRTNA